MPRADFYADPQVYDVLHAGGTAADLRVLLKLGRRYTPAVKNPTWLEPACGTGRYLIAAARRGIRAMGFDISEPMVNYAREQAAASAVARRLTVFSAPMESFGDTGPVASHSVHLAFNLINTIRHLTTDRAMLAHFNQMAAALAPRGIYIVGLSLSAYGLEHPTEDTWRGRRGPLSVSQVVQYVPPAASGHDARRGSGSRVERVISHMTIRRGREESHIDSAYALRTYNLAQWLRLLDQSALRLVAVTDGDGKAATPVEPGYFLFVLAHAHEPRTR